MPQDYSVWVGDQERNLWGICINGQEQVATRVDTDSEWKYWMETEWYSEKEMVRLLKLKAFL